MRTRAARAGSRFLSASVDDSSGEGWVMLVRMGVGSVDVDGGRATAQQAFGEKAMEKGFCVGGKAKPACEREVTSWVDDS